MVVVKYYQLFLMFLCLGINMAVDGIAQTSNNFQLHHNKRNYFEQISIEQGLPHAWVSCILQDKSGFMWFGTQDGLAKYDGYQFTVYRYKQEDDYSISHNIIYCIYEDSNGFLWLTARGGGLNKFDPKAETFIHYRYQADNPHSLSYDDVYSIFEDSKGSFWIGTNGGGLNKFDPLTEKFTRYQYQADNSSTISNNKVKIIYEDSKNNLWIGTDGGGLCKFDRDTETFMHYKHQANSQHSISDNSVMIIYEDVYNNLWIGTKRGGLNKFDPETGIFTLYQHKINNIESFNSNFITSIIEDDRNCLWIGTYGGGIFKFDPIKEIFSHYQNEADNINSLASNFIYALYRDAGGNIWVGTQGGGVNKFDPYMEAFAHYRKEFNNPNSLINNQVWSFFEDSGNNIWIGTDGGLNRFDSITGNFIEYVHEPENSNSLSNSVINSIYEDSNRDFWIGTWFGGLNKFDLKTETFTNYFKSADSSNRCSPQIVTRILEGVEGNLWIGSYGEGLYGFDKETETFFHFQHQPDDPLSLNNNFINTMIKNTNGGLWIGTLNGLSKFDPKAGTFKNYQYQADTLNSLSHKIVISLFRDADSTLWIGTDGGGLNKFNLKTETFIHYKEKDGLPNNSILGILKDDSQNLWLSTNKGISKFNPQSETFHNYNKDDGLQSDGFNIGAYFKDSVGRMYFGGINGYNVFYPDSVKENTYIAPVVITDFLLFNKSIGVRRPGIKSDQFQLDQHINFTRQITLNYTDYIFALEFSALSYRQPEKNQYKYKLEGFDKDWIETDYMHRRATYTNLSYGKYEFKVMASNDDGYWSEDETSVIIRILPPFWKTLWFRLMMVLLMLGVIITVHKMRTNYILKRNKELEKHNLELEQAEDEMRHLRNMLSNIINSMPSALIGVDVEGRVIQWNNRAEKVTHINAEQAKGQMVYKVFPQCRLEMNKIKQAIKNRRIEQAFKVKQPLAGEMSYCDITVFPLIANGVKGAVIRVDDVTERVRLEEMMIQSEKMMSVGGLAAGMAHEINNPLAGIIQTMQVMQNRVSADLPKNLTVADECGISFDKLVEYHKERGLIEMMKTVMESARHAATIVDNMLSFSRKSESKFVPADIKDLVDKTIELCSSDYDMRKNYDFKNLEIIREYERNLPWISCEASKIQQVILNLLKNGAQAMQKENEKLKIENGEIKKSCFILRLAEDEQKNMMRIEIEDNGPGMDEATRRRIFEPFFTTKAEGSGTGLGLSVSYFIITENHGGRMWVESIPGKGAKFIITLPVLRSNDI
ncbi:PAS domain S-box protein [bacterium]|nr:PAS domain S-box protein [bacterium]